MWNNKQTYQPAIADHGLQTNKQIAIRCGLSARMKTTTDTIYAWQFKDANTMPTVLCMSNGLICDYITDVPAADTGFIKWRFHSNTNA